MTLRRVTITIDVDTDTDDATLDTRLSNYLNEEDLDSTLLGEEIRFVEFNLTITDPPGGIGIGDHVRSKGGLAHGFVLAVDGDRARVRWIGGTVDMEACDMLDVLCHAGRLKEKPEREMLTLIEYMPAYLRESHLAARNKGVWPANGSVRVYVIGEITDAQLDPDWADVIKTIEAAELPDGAEVLADIPEDALRSVPDEEREPMACVNATPSTPNPQPPKANPMTFEQATALGRKDGEADVREVLAEQGLDVIKATLAPGHVSWDEGAINAGAAALAGVPEKFHRAYYEAYRDAARALAVELTERDGLPS